MWNTGRVIGRNGRVGGLIHHGPVSAAPRFSQWRSLSIDDAMSQQDDQRADRDPDNPGIRRVKPDDRIGGPSSHNAPITADRATILAHELNNLLDGSIRCLGIAQHSLAVQFAATEAESLETARRQMEAVQTALERMCELVHASMMGESVRTHSLLKGQKAQRVNDAVAHAIEVVRPGADQAGVTIDSDLDDTLNDAPAGPLYSAVLNALQNAIEAVIRTGGSGKVNVLTRRDVLSMDVSGRGARVILEVHDEGVGLPTHMPADKLFELGVSTKGGTGVGLGIIRQIVHDLGGQVELLPRGSMGACLRMTFPCSIEPGVE